MKNVLLLGDSIRMAYQPKVKALLSGRANVFGPMDNGRWSDYTLNSLRFWLPQMPDPHIVHLNNGFWDIGDNYQEGSTYTPIEEYERDMGRIVSVLRKQIAPDIKIIIALTTPWLAGPLKEVERFNDALRRLAKQEGLMVNDLYTPFAVEPSKYIGDDQIHLNDEGIAIAAEQVAKAIEIYL